MTPEHSTIIDLLGAGGSGVSAITLYHFLYARARMNGGSLAKKLDSLYRIMNAHYRLSLHMAKKAGLDTSLADRFEREANGD